MRDREMAATTLPPLPLPLDQMTETELCNFVPQMVRSSTGKYRPFQGKNPTPPDWWPADVPYANPKTLPQDKRRTTKEAAYVRTLRHLISLCYKSHGQEHLLKKAGKSSSTTDKTKDSSKMTQKDMASVAAPLSQQDKVRVSPNNLYPSPAMASLPTAATQPGSADSTPQKGDESPFVEVFICFFCEKQFPTRNKLQSHQKECGDRSKDNTDNSSFRTPPKRSRDSDSKATANSAKLQLELENTVKTKEKISFLEIFKLGSISKVEAMKRRQQRNKVDCGLIDFAEDPCPKTPSTPRSAKSLISQLSRDMSPTSVQRHLMMEEEFNGSSDSESTKSDSNEEVNVGRSATLYAIDLTSILGQRIKRHNASDKQQQNLEEDNDRHSYEPFCHTPKKDAFPSRLRNRQNPFPVTYKKKKGSGHYCHEYKFNKKDRQEFKIKLRTGLNSRARGLKAQLQNCKVVMHKFTPKEIRRFTRPRPRHFIDMRMPNWQMKYLSGPMYLQGTPHFPQGVFMNGSPVDLQRMLGVRMPNLAMQQARSGVRFPSLSQMVAPRSNREVQRPAQAVTASAAMPQVQGLFPNLARQMGLVPSGVPQSTFYRQPGSPSSGGVPLHVLQRQQLNAAQMRSDDHSKENKMASPIKKGQMVDSHKKPMAMTNGNVKNFGSLDSTSSDGSKSRSKKVDDDVIAISSSDDEESSTPDSRTKKRKRSQQKDDCDNKRQRLADDKNSASPNKRNQAVLFRCHLCFAEIMFNLATTEFISRHFAQEHKVPNIQILEHRDERGQLVLSIVEDSQLEQATAAQNRKTQSSTIKAAINSAQEKRRQAALSSAGGKAGSDDVICID